MTTQHLGGWWLVFVGVTLLVLLGRLFTILNNLRNRLAKNTLADYFEARVERGGTRWAAVAVGGKG